MGDGFYFASEDLVLLTRSETICYAIRDHEGGFAGFARLSVSVGLAEE